MSEQKERVKVSGKTRPQALAGNVAQLITKDGVDPKNIEIVAVGAGAVNQAVKGLIMTRRFVSSAGINLAFIPAFETLEIDGKEVTAIKYLPVAL